MTEYHNRGKSLDLWGKVLAECSKSPMIKEEEWYQKSVNQWHKEVKEFTKKIEEQE